MRGLGVGEVERGPRLARNVYTGRAGPRLVTKSCYVTMSHIIAFLGKYIRGNFAFGRVALITDASRAFLSLRDSSSMSSLPVLEIYN